MKKFLSVIIVGLVLIACQKEQPEKTMSNLMDVVQNAKTAASDYYSMQEYVDFRTKSSDENSKFYVPQWAYTYISEYMSPEDVEDWDSQRVCELIDRDLNLIQDQKEYTAYVIGVLEYIKDTALSIAVQTRLSDEDCLALYKQTIKEILLADLGVAIIGGALGGVIGAELATLGGLLTSWKEVKEAGREYVRCTA